MTKIDDGGSAFPAAFLPTPLSDSPDYKSGMSLRDYFAGQALIAIYDKGGRYGPEGMKQVAEYAYAAADAMLTARAKQETDK